MRKYHAGTYYPKLRADPIRWGKVLGRQRERYRTDPVYRAKRRARVEAWRKKNKKPKRSAGGVSIDKKKQQSFYFPEEMLAEITEEMDRLGRPITWGVQTAWKLAREEIKKIPRRG